jgi:hypothetical protein
MKYIPITKIAAIFIIPIFSQAQGDESNKQGGFMLGAYYYPWYDAPKNENDIGWMKKALRGRLKPVQLPKLGVYDSRDPKVIKDHIEQSKHARIDFWSVSWWGKNRQDKTFKDHILKHPDAAKLKYAVLYESTGRLGSMRSPSYKNLVPDFDYFNEQYFNHPNYLKVDGKPVVFIYLTRVYFRRDDGKKALKFLRLKYPNLYIVGDDVFGPNYPASAASQWNAITAYDVYGQSTKITGGTKAGIERLKKNYSSAKIKANKVGAGFVPAIAPGYNDRAVRKGNSGRSRFFDDVKGSKEGDLFRSMIKDVAMPLADPKAKKMIMVTSFNEWYEDTQIEPTSGKAKSPVSKDDSESGNYFTEDNLYHDYGSLYLDILRSEFRQ